MRRLGYAPHALVESLHAAQEAFGYLDKPAMQFVATGLRVPLSRVYGAATFYHFFSLKPPGDHTCVVCTGTACHIKGAPDLLSAVAAEFSLKAGETSKDGKFSVLSARCIGTCGLAPAVVFDSEVAGKVTSEQMLERLRGWAAS